jgi:hypothetical protein
MLGAAQGGIRVNGNGNSNSNSNSTVPNVRDFGVVLLI